MSEEATTETTPDGGADAPADPAQALLEASDLLWADGDAEAPAGDAEPPADDDAPAEEVEPAEEAPEPEETPEPEPEPEKPSAFEHAQIRRQRKQLERREAELTARMAQLEQQQRTIAERDQKAATLQQRFRDDPEGALTEIASRAGMTPEAFYDRLTERRLGGGNPGEGELMQRIADLEKRIASEASAKEQAAKEAAQRQQQQEHGSAIAKDVATIVDVADDPALAEKWPHLAALSPYERQHKANDAIRYCLAQGRADITLDAIADALDNQARETYGLKQAANAAQVPGSPGASQKPAGEGNPAKKPRGASRTVSNADVAQSSGGPRRDLTPSEALDQADELLRGWASAQYG